MFPEVTDFSVDRRFADAVEIFDSAAQPVLNLQVLEDLWWSQQRSLGATRRAWIGILYPETISFDWEVSFWVLRPPSNKDGHFGYSAAPSVLKWTARARSGALATQARLLKNQLVTSSQCPCCLGPEEDDLHALTACSRTGSVDSLAVVSQIWLKVGSARSVSLPPPPSSWIAAHLPQLVVGLIPTHLRTFLPNVSDGLVRSFLRDFHLGLVCRLAELLRRRQLLLPKAPVSRLTSSAPPHSSRHLPPSRCLSVTDLRAAESGSRTTSSPLPRVSSYRRAGREAAVSLHTWVKQHPHLRPVPVADGEPSVALMLLWEADHRTLFPSRSSAMKARLGAFTKRLLTAVEADPELSQWLETKVMHTQLSLGVPWNSYQKWSVRIDTAVGEPFVSSWKTYLVDLAVRPRWPSSQEAKSPPWDQAATHSCSSSSG